MNNKKIIKLFSCTTLILCILVSYSSLSFATDDSLYVWSSTSNSLNILDDNIKPSNTTTNNSNTNTSNSTNNSTNSTSNNINVNSNNTNSNKTNTNSTNTNSSDNNSLETSTIADVTDNNSLNLESASAILIEQSSGRILYAHNIHEQLRPASVTKVMSILLIMESLANGKISLEDQVPCSENAASMGGSQIWLDTRETLTVDEMLKAICVNSANDCVVAMAEYIAGSEDAFVQMMNDKAKELRNE